jgi:cell division protein FtsQ
MNRRFRKLGLVFLVVTSLVLVSIHVLASYGPREMFTVRSIVVQGTRQTTVEEIIALAGAKTGVDIFEADLRAMAAAVNRHPWVAKARISRSFPSTLRIEVTERRPLALVASGELFAVDDRGVLLPIQNTQLLTDLPLITGLPVSSADLGKPLRGIGATGLIQTLQILRSRQPNLAARISELRWLEEVGVVATLVGSGTQIVLGDRDFDARLDRLALVLRYLDLRDRLADFRYLDTRFAGQVIGKQRAL